MQINESYSHNRGIEIFKLMDSNTDIEDAVIHSDQKFKKRAPSKIKKEFSSFLCEKAWIDRVKLGNSRLTVNFLKDKIGVCIQIGNVARTYADLLKLNYLGNNDIIDVGVILVPALKESKLLGNNYANYERLISEVKMFDNQLDTPMVIYQLIN